MDNLEKEKKEALSSILVAIARYQKDFSDIEDCYQSIKQKIEKVECFITEEKILKQIYEASLPARVQRT